MSAVVQLPNIVCDSSSLISLSETCCLGALQFLKRASKTAFFVPPEVKRESVDRPLKIEKYEYSAVRLGSLVEQKVLVPAAFPENPSYAEKLLRLSNNLFSVRGRPLQLVHRGEAECLAVYKQVNAQALLIDEKTTRLLVEDPQKLVQKISGEYPEKISVNKELLEQWSKATQEIFVLRSTELLAIASSKGFLKHYGSLEKQALRAALHALRNAGCSIAEEEIREEAEYKFTKQQ